MSKTITIKLGSVDYVIPAFNFEQTRRACEFVRDGLVDPFNFLAIALERATPEPPSLEEIEFDIDEVTTAVQSITKFCGLASAPKAPHAFR